MRWCLWLGGLAIGGCTDPASLPADSDPAADSDPIPGCDFSALGGTWSGDVGGPLIELWDAVVTLESTAALDARIGIVHWGKMQLPTLRCTSELICTGRQSLKFEVVIERGIENPELCNDEYAFFRPDPDGTMAFFIALGEYDEPHGTGTLSRIE